MRKKKNISINPLVSSGFFATSDSYTYHFIEVSMSWYDAHHYCSNSYNELLQPQDNIDISTLDTRKYPKAWIGVHKYSSSSAWMDGSDPIYSNWSATATSGGAVGLCVLITNVGDWYEHNCSDTKPYVCYNGGYKIKILKYSQCFKFCLHFIGLCFKNLLIKSLSQSPQEVC